MFESLNIYQVLDIAVLFDSLDHICVSSIKTSNH